ncbi:triose-phosphate isomerase [Aquincola sp. S2]|uniref:Triosephosphate isomerase n=1 Tax=Pseudaquabacterium terrae TaxID=2732868 RepID=A0ABX2EPM6_9BURK|nr:triose-phosphate isomerase [Aquabacterium terrae]NRF70495.1 triose-phosphate isomerase [Aquabacterium terrae]
MRRKLVAGNWKMHGNHKANADLLAAIVAARPFGCDVAVCVPFPYLSETAVTLTGTDVRWGAQDCSAHEQGAYTGEVSIGMLAEFGCRHVIVGHSERRQYHHESDQLVADKAKAALARGVTPIVCVGETLAERDTGQTEVVVKRQLSAVIHTLGHCAGEMVVAYEPVWAIGTGRTATPEQAQAVHALLRAQLQAATAHAADMKILYGGSVKPDNAATLFAQPDIDGGLIGGASLKAADFVAICRAAA